MFEVARLSHPKDVYGFARLNALQTAAQPKGPLSYRAVRLYQGHQGHQGRWGGRSGRCSILDHFKIFQVSNHELYEGSSGLTNKHPISIGWLSLLELKLPVPWCSHLLAWVPNIQQLEDHPTHIVAIQ